MTDNDQYMSLSFVKISPEVSERILEAVNDIAAGTSYSVYFADPDDLGSEDEMTAEQRIRLDCLTRARKDVVGTIALRPLTAEERYQVKALADEYARFALATEFPPARIELDTAPHRV